MSWSACLGIQVCTNDARFSAGVPSRVSSSWMSWYVESASVPWMKTFIATPGDCVGDDHTLRGSLYLGMGSVP